MASVNSSGYPTFFLGHLEHVIKECQKDQSAALILISIDNLPMIISGFGHHACEDAIRALTSELGEYMGFDVNAKRIFRIQKDQLAFTITAPSDTLRQTDDALLGALAGKIMNFGYESNYGVIHVLASLSYIVIPSTDMAPEELVSQAFIALKQGKGVHSSSYEPIPIESGKSRHEMNMVSYLTSSIRNQEFCLAFQPIISSKNGDIAYYEALLRLRKEDGSLSSAGPLVPVAERMGLIEIIDNLVLDKVVEQMKAEPDLRLSFNVSNLTANSDTWFANFSRMAHRHPDIASRMMVEITETAVHLDIRKTAYFVAALQANGVKVALDDFGSGYTSFRQLKSLSIDVVKIDGIFIHDLIDNHDNHLFIRTMLDFTRGFGLETVAEFVENGETAKLLMELGVNYMQGYYFGFPEARDANLVGRGLRQ